MRHRGLRLRRCLLSRQVMASRWSKSLYIDWNAIYIQWNAKHSRPPATAEPHFHVRNNHHQQPPSPGVLGDGADRKDKLFPDLEEPSFIFQRGCRLCIQAESGSGKSSLLSFIFGTRQDYKGRFSSMVRTPAHSALNSGVRFERKTFPCCRKTWRFSRN